MAGEVPQVRWSRSSVHHVQPAHPLVRGGSAQSVSHGETTLNRTSVTRTVRVTWGGRHRTPFKSSLYCPVLPNTGRAHPHPRIRGQVFVRYPCRTCEREACLTVAPRPPPRHTRTCVQCAFLWPNLAAMIFRRFMLFALAASFMQASWAAPGLNEV